MAKRGRASQCGDFAAARHGMVAAGSGKGIVFITIEDEFGTANLVVYPDIGARDRAAMIGTRLLVAEGRVERRDEVHGGSRHAPDLPHAGRPLGPAGRADAARRRGAMGRARTANRAGGGSRMGGPKCRKAGISGDGSPWRT